MPQGQLSGSRLFKAPSSFSFTEAAHLAHVAVQMKCKRTSGAFSFFLLLFFFGCFVRWVTAAWLTVMWPRCRIELPTRGLTCLWRKIVLQTGSQSFFLTTEALKWVTAKLDVVCRRIMMLVCVQSHSERSRSISRVANNLSNWQRYWKTTIFQ